MDKNDASSPTGYQIIRSSKVRRRLAERSVIWWS